ncbi:hypothetical protein ACK1C0_003380 [Salmonella enterica]
MAVGWRVNPRSPDEFLRKIGFLVAKNGRGSKLRITAAMPDDALLIRPMLMGDVIGRIGQNEFESVSNFTLPSAGFFIISLA